MKFKIQISIFLKFCIFQWPLFFVYEIKNLGCRRYNHHGSLPLWGVWWGLSTADVILSIFLPQKTIRTTSARRHSWQRHSRGILGGGHAGGHIAMEEKQEYERALLEEEEHRNMDAQITEDVARPACHWPGGGSSLQGPSPRTRGGGGPMVLNRGGATVWHSLRLARCQRLGRCLGAMARYPRSRGVRLWQAVGDQPWLRLGLVYC